MIPEYEIFKTRDDSHSVQLVGSFVSFHSMYGAIQESMNVFIKNGLEFFIEKYSEDRTIALFEVGFGTGLNAVLTAKTALQHGKSIVYHTIDLYPVPPQIYKQLNYDKVLQMPNLHQAIMQSSWNEELPINQFFVLEKIKADFINFSFLQKYDLIFFDAFAPEDQEEMWSDAVFKKIFDALATDGVLVTYCSKSVVRKALQCAGFTVEKLPGPQGKREVVRAIKV